MIGVIQYNKIFEFRDEYDLAQAIGWFIDKYGCDTAIIVDTSDKVKAIIKNDNFIFAPNITEDQKYYIYGAVKGDFSDLTKNDYLPNNVNWEIGGLPFAYTVQKVPKDLDLY